jgi:type VI secretion system protein ImpI
MILTLEISGQPAASLGARRRKEFGATGGGIGRLPDNDWVLPGEYISGHHARIQCRSGQFFVEDTSTNGVCVNSPDNRIQRGRPYPIKSGDLLYIDVYEIKVAVTQEERPSEPLVPAGVGSSAQKAPYIPDDPFAIDDNAAAPVAAPAPQGGLQSARRDPRIAPSAPLVPSDPFGGLEDPGATSGETDPLKLLGLDGQKRPAAAPPPRASDLASGSRLSDSYRPPPVRQSEALERPFIPEDAFDESSSPSDASSRHLIPEDALEEAPSPGDPRSPDAIPDDYDPLAPETAAISPPPRPTRPPPRPQIASAAAAPAARPMPVQARSEAPAPAARAPVRPAPEPSPAAVSGRTPPSAASPPAVPRAAPRPAPPASRQGPVPPPPAAASVDAAGVQRTSEGDPFAQTGTFRAAVAPPVSVAPPAAPRVAANPPVSVTHAAAPRIPTPPPVSAAARRESAQPSASPRVADAGGHAANFDFTAFLEGAGIGGVEVSPELARDFGMILRVVIGGLMDVLRARERIKDEFRMRVTTFKAADNNPLKFSANVEDALHNLLVKRNAAYLGPVEAFEDAFSDVRHHQMAMLAGVRVAYEAMLAEFDPERLQTEFDRGGKKGLLGALGPSGRRHWDLYCELFRDRVRDADSCFRELFGDEFAKAYEEQLARLRTAQRHNEK